MCRVLNIIYTDNRSEDINESYRSDVTSHYDEDGFTLVTRKQYKKQYKKGAQKPKAMSKAGHKAISKAGHKKDQKTKTGKKTEKKG